MWITVLIVHIPNKNDVNNFVENFSIYPQYEKNRSG